MQHPAIVLATVNAPYSTQISGPELASCLRDHAKAVTVPGHMSSFFGDVAPSLQIAFADQYGVPYMTLISAAKAFQSYSGESYPLAA